MILRPLSAAVVGYYFAWLKVITTAWEVLIENALDLNHQLYFFRVPRVYHESDCQLLMFDYLSI